MSTKVTFYNKYDSQIFQVALFFYLELRQQRINKEVCVYSELEFLKHLLGLGTEEE